MRVSVCGRPHPLLGNCHIRITLMLFYHSHHLSHLDNSYIVTPMATVLSNVCMSKCYCVEMHTLLNSLRENFLTVGTHFVNSSQKFLPS